MIFSVTALHGIAYTARDLYEPANKSLDKLLPRDDDSKEYLKGTFDRQKHLFVLNFSNGGCIFPVALFE